MLVLVLRLKFYFIEFDKIQVIQHFGSNFAWQQRQASDQKNRKPGASKDMEKKTIAFSFANLAVAFLFVLMHVTSKI